MTFREILDNTTFVVITDPAKPDRFGHIRDILTEKFNIRKEKIAICNAIMLPNNPSLGCNLSQMSAMTMFPDDGYLAVIEDDVQLSSDFDFSLLDDDFGDINSWDSLYLGISAWGYDPSAPTKARLNFVQAFDPPVLSNRIIRAQNMLSTHAIMYFNKSYAEKIKDGVSMASLPNYREPNDLTNARNQVGSNVFALMNPMFYQGGRHEYCTRIRLDKKKQENG